MTQNKCIVFFFFPMSHSPALFGGLFIGRLSGRAMAHLFASFFFEHELKDAAPQAAAKGAKGRVFKICFSSFKIRNMYDLN